MNVQNQAIFAGLFFGTWPLLMNRSGLPGMLSGFVFSALVAMIVFPFAFGQMKGLIDIKWGFVILAGLIGALGIMSFNGMLSKAKPMEVSSLFVIMILVQTAVPVIYQVILDKGSISDTKIIGFILAGIAAYLLSKK